MTKQEILKTLKLTCANTALRLPRDLHICSNGNKLTIKLSKEFTCKNMQVDSASFEGWALVLKRWLKDINEVAIEWDVPDKNNIKENENQHYQRFLYRVIKFTDTITWAKVVSKNKECLQHSKVYNGKKNVLNVPSKSRTRKIESKTLIELSENELENIILSDSNIFEHFKNKFDLKLADNQLPVGVFDEVKSNKTKIFTGGKSAIDIWGITNDGKTCCLFELKDAGNKKVGALSEMLFYSFVIKDVNDGKMEFHSLTYPGLKEVTEAEKVECLLLAPNRHSLIDAGVFQLMNEADSGIKFGNVKITEKLTFEIL